MSAWPSVPLHTLVFLVCVVFEWFAVWHKQAVHRFDGWHSLMMSRIIFHVCSMFVGVCIQNKCNLTMAFMGIASFYHTFSATVTQLTFRAFTLRMVFGFEAFAWHILFITPPKLTFSIVILPLFSTFLPIHPFCPGSQFTARSIIGLFRVKITQKITCQLFGAGAPLYSASRPRSTSKLTFYLIENDYNLVKWESLPRNGDQQIRFIFIRFARARWCPTECSCFT